MIVEIDGQKYKLVPVDPPTLPESYKDCMQLLNDKKAFYIDNVSDIREVPLRRYKMHTSIHASLTNCVPSRKCAEQILAASQLFVIWWTLNGGPYYPEKTESRYSILIDDEDVLDWYEDSVSHNPFPFRTKELVQHAIKIAEPIWLKYFGK